MMFHLDPSDPDGVQKIVSALYPPGAKHCMMDCQFSTGYWDGSGAYCNNPESDDFKERVRSWDTVRDCAQFVEGERLVDRDEDSP